jgi:hypothetical protein
MRPPVLASLGLGASVVKILAVFQPVERCHITRRYSYAFSAKQKPSPNFSRFILDECVDLSFWSLSIALSWVISTPLFTKPTIPKS